MSGFTSFVDYDDGVKPKIAVSSHLNDPIRSPSNTEIKQIEISRKEIEVCSSNNVSFSMQFGESEQGLVICTDFRLRFTPTIYKPKNLPQRSKWFDDFYDVPLCSIHSILVSLVKNNTKRKVAKFHKMAQNLSSMEVVSMIRLTLKDMRVVTIDFRRSQNGTAMANRLFFFSNCGPIDKMTQVGIAVKNEKNQISKIPFNSVESWKNEMKRCGLKYDSSAPWRICSMNKEGLKMTANGYPMYTVIPTFLSRTEIDRFMQNWKLGRFPVWVWSRKNYNSSLMICSENESNLATPDIMLKLSENVARCHPKNEKPFCMHLDKNFAANVGEAYNNLIKFCSIDSYEQIIKKQNSWELTKHQTGWLHLINKCLLGTKETIDWIISRDRTVILFEEEGRDMSLIVASLTQICCDPFFRTINGFQSLIEKMWIAFGHPFGQRLLGRDDEFSQKLNTPRKSTNRFQIYPTWLMFLDCVAQLHRLNEIQFGFSIHYLISLWDLSFTGIVSAFTCNNLTEQLAFGLVGGPFPVESYFTIEYCELFKNVWHDAAVFMNFAQKYFPKHTCAKSVLIEIIRPPTSIANVALWNECYFRWVPALNLKNSGNLSKSLALDEKMLKLSQKLRCAKWEKHYSLPSVYCSSYPYCNPETFRPEIGFIGSSSIDFEIIRRPDELDDISMTSSFTSISFNQTPINYEQSISEKNNGKYERFFEKEENSSINVQPKQQIVKFTKNYSDYDNIAQVHQISKETPILLNDVAQSNPPIPAQRMIFATDKRPIPPPRPSNLTDSKIRNDSRKKYESDNVNTVTRF